MLPALTDPQRPTAEQIADYLLDFAGDRNLEIDEAGFDRLAAKRDQISALLADPALTGPALEAAITACLAVP
jgi:hypothetical protein